MKWNPCYPVMGWTYIGLFRSSLNKQFLQPTSLPTCENCNLETLNSLHLLPLCLHQWLRKMAAWLIFHSHGLDHLVKSGLMCKFAIEFSHFSPLIPFFSHKLGTLHDISNKLPMQGTHTFSCQNRLHVGLQAALALTTGTSWKASKGSNRKRQNLKSHPKYTKFKSCITAYMYV